MLHLRLNQLQSCVLSVPFFNIFNSAPIPLIAVAFGPKTRFARQMPWSIVQAAHELLLQLMSVCV